MLTFSHDYHPDSASCSTRFCCFFSKCILGIFTKISSFFFFSFLVFFSFLTFSYPLFPAEILLAPRVLWCNKTYLFLSLPIAQHTVPTILELLQVMSCFVTCQGNSGSWDLFLWPNSVAVCSPEESTAWLECRNFQIHHPLDFCRGKKCKCSGWSWRANDSFNQAFPKMDSAKSQWMSFRES